MPEQVVVADRMFVTSVFKDGAQQTVLKDEKKDLEIRIFETEPAKVFVGLGLTISLKQYESIRIDVGLSVPCYVEEKEAAYVHALKWVEERVGMEKNAIMSVKTGDKGI